MWDDDDQDNGIHSIMDFFSYSVVMESDDTIIYGPMGTIMLIAPLQKWLESNIGQRSQMKWAWFLNNNKVIFKFQNEDDAFLFKMRWG